MPPLPISATRTSTPLSTQRLLFQLNSDQIALQQKFDQLSTGRRVLRMSDDPIAANRAISLHKGIDLGEQLLRNANSTTSFYQATDSTLARVDNALILARGAALEAAQTVISEDERVALAGTVRETINSVFAAGNALYRDHQLLGGFLESGVAYEYDNQDIVFTGTNATGRTELGAGQPAAINVTGNEGLGTNAVFMKGDSLNASINVDSRLVDLRQGEGVTPGKLRLSGGSNWVDLDLTPAGTIGDVVELVNTVSIDGRPLNASLVNGGIRIEYADGLSGTLAIQDAVGSSMAKELGISNPSGIQAPPLIGNFLTPRVTAATKISDLDNGAGLDLTSGIQLLQGDKTFVIELDEAETVGDVLIAINRSGGDVHAELNEAEGRIQLRARRSGVDYSLGENGGGAARSLGIRTATELTKLAELGRGQGMSLNADGPDLIITRPDGTELPLDLNGLESVADVMQLIADHPQNQDAQRVLVDLNDFGNGLQLKAPPGAANLSIRQVGISDAGLRLGLVAPGANDAVGSIVGPADTIIGSDFAPRDAGGVLDTLLRLERAIGDGEIPEITRLQLKLDDDFDRASRSRGRVGVLAKNLQQLQNSTENKVIQLRGQLSDEVDADLATVISELTQRQTALDASMRLMGQTSKMTILNFL
ncbi:flagellar hook protein [Rubripirellula sp.]|jgi:flagellar hook-associated protein 3 FlgL|nr:flagellar hook protein [Rubripirellula sp.]MDF1843689.1 flagellar hook protein [Rubripirellula sp.]